MDIEKRTLAEDMREFAKKEGLEVKIVPAAIDAEAAKEVSDFIGLIEKAHQETAKSKLKFDYCPPVLYHK
jgi:hypothetical protein